MATAQPTEADLTEDERLLVEERLHDILRGEMDEIAVSLGLRKQGEGEPWTDEEADRIIAECDRQWRDGVIADVLADRPYR